jgi:hypothetical protein
MTPSDLIEHAVSVFSIIDLELLTAAFDDQLVLPRAIDVARPDDSEPEFPEWDGSVLLLLRENQNVCRWGLALDGPSAGEIVVGGYLGNGQGTVVHRIGGLAAFVASRTWDAHIAREPLLQTCAAPLDDPTLATLRAGFAERVTTFGWPSATNRRFERGGVRIWLNVGERECYWCISGPDDELRAALLRLRHCSDLDTSLWSNDAGGMSLLNDA